MPNPGDLNSDTPRAHDVSEPAFGGGKFSGQCATPEGTRCPEVTRSLVGRVVLPAVRVAGQREAPGFRSEATVVDVPSWGSAVGRPAGSSGPVDQVQPASRSSTVVRVATMASECCSTVSP
jgi:hypothetical protein